MVDPHDVTRFDRTDEELLEFWLFSLFVRGKNADVQAQKLDLYLKEIGGAQTITRWSESTIFDDLMRVKAGQYRTLAAAIYDTGRIIKCHPAFLRHAHAYEMERIRGVGPKTARYFIMHSREDAGVAALDTHILRFLATQTSQRVPTSTPTGVRYKKLERMFLDIARAEGVSPAEMDLAIWKASRSGNCLAWRDYL